MRHILNLSIALTLFMPFTGDIDPRPGENTSEQRERLEDTKRNNPEMEFCGPMAIIRAQLNLGPGPFDGISCDVPKD